MRAADGTTTQIIASDGLAECFRPSEANAVYGLTWWLPRDAADLLEADGERGNPLQAARQREQMGPIVDPAGNPLEAYVAAGLGKQRLIVIPAQRMVIVRFAEATPAGQQYTDGDLVRLLLGGTHGP